MLTARRRVGLECNGASRLASKMLGGGLRWWADVVRGQNVVSKLVHRLPNAPTSVSLTSRRKQLAGARCLSLASTPQPQPRLALHLDSAVTDRRSAASVRVRSAG